MNVNHIIQKRIHFSLHVIREGLQLFFNIFHYHFFSKFFRGGDPARPENV